MTQASSLLLVAYPGWVDARYVRVSGLVTTIGVSQVGTLSALLPAKDSNLYGFTEWKGLWCRSDIAGQDPWSGEIVDTKPTSTGRTIELVARSPAFSFALRRLPDTFLPVMAMPGSLAKAAISAVATRRYLWVGDTAFDETGRPMNGEARADDLLAYLTLLSQQSGQEWVDGTNDDGSWLFRWRRLAGQDKTDRVRLVEGYHCTDFEDPESIQGLVNDLLAIGDDRPYAVAAKIVVTDADSLEQPWGRREGAIRYSGTTSESGLQPLAAADVARLSVPALAPTFRMPARLPIAAEIRPGDRIFVSSWSANKELVFRPLVISVSDNGTILTLTGTAEEFDPLKVAA